MTHSNDNRKVALVTGGLGGIGSECVKLFAEQGYHVIVTSRDQSRIDDMEAILGVAHTHLEGIATDLGSQDAIQELLDRIPTPDVLVNNAGLNRPRHFLDIQPHDFDDVFDINVRTLYFLTQAVAARMIERGISGRVVNISSQAGVTGLPQRSVYCASKHAVEGFTKAVAVDLKGYGIRINNVAPTFVETEMTKTTLSQESFQQLIQSKILLETLPTARDVAQAVWFLASDNSRSITGTTLRIDAGWTAH